MAQSVNVGLQFHMAQSVAIGLQFHMAPSVDIGLEFHMAQRCHWVTVSYGTVCCDD